MKEPRHITVDVTGCDVYSITLPSGQRTVLVIPSPLADADRAVITGILALIPVKPPAERHTYDELRELHAKRQEG